jgi:hypothetical protein
MFTQHVKLRTAGNALARFLQASGRARVLISSLLRLAVRIMLENLSMRLGNRILTALHDLGESHQAATPKCHLPRCEPSKFEHVGEDVGSMGQST